MARSNPRFILICRTDSPYGNAAPPENVRRGRGQHGGIATHFKRAQGSAFVPLAKVS